MASAMPREVETTLAAMLQLLDYACDAATPTTLKRRSLEQLGMAIQPHNLPAQVKHLFVHRAVQRGYVDTAVSLIENGGDEIASVVCDFLGDFAFNSDAAGQAVRRAFTRIVDGLAQAFGRAPAQQQSPLVRSFISLCANIVATSIDGHHLLMPLVRSVFLPIIRDPRSSDRLLGSTILLLANLSTTVERELREVGCAEALLELVVDSSVPLVRKSVAESVVIFLLGHKQCDEVDQLLSMGVIQDYCLPILKCALEGTDFRGMYPHLVYSARLFTVLANSHDYAATLMGYEEVPILLQQATKRKESPVCLESDDLGRSFALQALERFAYYGLWPKASDTRGMEFVSSELLVLLDDANSGVRTHAAALWGRLHMSHVYLLLLVGDRLSEEGMMMAPQVWREHVLGFLFPFLSATGY